MSSKKFGFQPELIYSQMGYKATSLFSESSSYSYLSLPLLLRYNLTDNFSLQAGPQVSYLLTASSKGNFGIKNIANETSTLDLGGTFGFGLDFGKFNAGGRYYLGFSNLQKNYNPNSGDLEITNNAFQLFIGYKLFGK
jgi:hypothetical protein